MPSIKEIGKSRVSRFVSVREKMPGDRRLPGTAIRADGAAA
jgi:hypothetical protein